MGDDYAIDNSQSRRYCAFCNGFGTATVNLMKCSGCLITYYCNRDHQLADWKRHKQFCKELQARRTISRTVTCEKVECGNDRVITAKAAVQSIERNSDPSGSIQTGRPTSEQQAQSIPSFNQSPIDRPIDQHLQSAPIINGHVPSVIVHTQQRARCYKPRQSIRSRGTDQMTQSVFDRSLSDESINQEIGLSVSNQSTPQSTDQWVPNQPPSQSTARLLSSQSINSASTHRQSVISSQPIEKTTAADSNKQHLHFDTISKFGGQASGFDDHSIVPKYSSTSRSTTVSSTEKITSPMTNVETPSATNFASGSIRNRVNGQCIDSDRSHHPDQSDRDRRLLESISETVNSSSKPKAERDEFSCMMTDSLRNNRAVARTATSASSAVGKTAKENQKRPRSIADHQRGGDPPKTKRCKRSAGADSNSPSGVASSSKSIDKEYGPKKDHSLNSPLDLDHDGRFPASSTGGSRLDNVMSSRLAKIAQFAAAGLREYGWAVVDKFLGERHCREVLKELQTFQERGDFTEARLLNSMAGTQLQGVRSDTILFLTNGSDDGIHVGLLVAIIDSLIFHLAGSIPPYNIGGRTRPMLTCYPGQRSRYITHVDNPDKDGRCVTATYYLNDDWRPAHGGLFRIYPVSAFKPVDIEPIFDRLVLYWSDRRNPHEVLPSYRKRFSINIWYYDTDEKAAADSRQLHCDSISPGERST